VLSVPRAQIAHLAPTERLVRIAHLVQIAAMTAKQSGVRTDAPNAALIVDALTAKRTATRGTQTVITIIITATHIAVM
jgi:hypothetical protein